MRQVGNDYGVSNSFLAKILSSGEILYEVATESDVYIRDICQAEDGKVYLLVIAVFPVELKHLVTKPCISIKASPYNNGNLSESFWGMVDWESGSCEFNTPLFGKLLEAAKRYDDNGRKKTV